MGHPDYVDVDVDSVTAKIAAVQARNRVEDADAAAVDEGNRDAGEDPSEQRKEGAIAGDEDKGDAGDVTLYDDEGVPVVYHVQDHKQFMAERIREQEDGTELGGCGSGNGVGSGPMRSTRKRGVTVSPMVLQQGVDLDERGAAKKQKKMVDARAESAKDASSSAEEGETRRASQRGNDALRDTCAKPGASKKRLGSADGAASARKKRRVDEDLGATGNTDADQGKKQKKTAHASAESAKDVSSSAEEGKARRAALRGDDAQRGTRAKPGASKKRKRGSGTAASARKKLRVDEDLDAAVATDADQVDSKAFPWLIPDGKRGFRKGKHKSVEKYVHSRVASIFPEFSSDPQWVSWALHAYETEILSRNLCWGTKGDGEIFASEFASKFFPISVNLRGSAGYFSAMRRKVEAMIRALGPPAWFLTVGPNEKEWRDQLIALYRDEILSTDPAATDAEVQAKIEALLADLDAKMAGSVDKEVRRFCQHSLYTNADTN